MFTISQASLKGGNDRRGVGGETREIFQARSSQSVERRIISNSPPTFYRLPDSDIPRFPKFISISISPQFFSYLSPPPSAASPPPPTFSQGPNDACWTVFLSIIASSGRLSSAPLLPAPLHLSPPPPSEERRRHTTCHLCKKATLLIEIVLCRD